MKEPPSTLADHSPESLKRKSSLTQEEALDKLGRKGRVSLSTPAPAAISGLPTALSQQRGQVPGAESTTLKVRKEELKKRDGLNKFLVLPTKFQRLVSVSLMWKQWYVFDMCVTMVIYMSKIIKKQDEGSFSSYWDLNIYSNI